VDPAELRAHLDRVLAAHGAAAPLAETHPHLFAALPVFVPAAQVREMTQVIQAIDTVAATAAFRSAVRRWAPEIASFDPGSPGGLLGFDFHRARGIEAVIGDPAELDYHAGRLNLAGADIGFVYNRCTDFALAEAGAATLRAAYSDHAVALSPHPWSHALYADKRNLSLLGDREWLAAAGVDEASTAALHQGVPRTEVMTEANRDALWQRRRQLFFKPAGGFGSRASYRGDKLTHKTWQQMAGADYVAQALVPPSQRHQSEGDVPLKVDIRAYAYRGRPLLFAARTYQGQTTNFRTPGGGFAPVLTLLDAPGGSASEPGPARVNPADPG